MHPGEACVLTSPRLSRRGADSPLLLRVTGAPLHQCSRGCLHLCEALANPEPLTWSALGCQEHAVGTCVTLLVQDMGGHQSARVEREARAGTGTLLPKALDAGC